jgi:hypothetical protein
VNYDRSYGIWIASMYCKVCGTQLVAGSSSCNGCGTVVAASGPLALRHSCGALIPKGVKFCRKCGARLENVQVSPASVSVAGVVPDATGTESTASVAAEKCLHCGGAILANAKFCKSCGKSRLAPKQPAALAESSPAPARAPRTLPNRAETARRTAASTRSRSRSVVLSTLAILLLAGLSGAGIWYWKSSHRKPSAQVNSPPGPTSTLAATPDSTPAPAQTGDTSNSRPGQPAPGPQESSAPSHTETQQQPAVTEIRSRANATRPEPAPSPERAKASAPPRPQGTPPPPPYQQAHKNAETAFATSRFIDPPDDSALYWARTAGQQGDPAATQLEAQVLNKMVNVVEAERAGHDYDSATTLISRLIQLFPERADLRQLANSLSQEQHNYARQLQQQRKAEELRAATKEFRLFHRHIMGLQGFRPVYGYCQGVLRITPDGMARFDCTRPDAQGRCHHLVFSASDIRDVELKNNGLLHLEAGSGKFDFQGSNAAIQGAADALRSLNHI